MKYFIKTLVVLAMAMAVVMLLHETTQLALPVFHLSLLGLFMFGSSNLVHSLTLKFSKKEPKRFPAYFMAITGIKMVTYLAAIGLYILLFREHVLAMLTAFLALYLIYMILEVATLVSDLRKQS